MRIAIYAGSFDPITNGHLSVLRSGLRLADKVIVAIGAHSGKKPLFTFAERKKLIADAVRGAFSAAEAKRVEIIAFDGLLAEKATELKAQILLRGLRSAGDLDYEMQMAGMNAKLAPAAQTVFIPAEEGTRLISSRLVRQIAALGGDAGAFVPRGAAEALAAKYQAQK